MKTVMIKMMTGVLGLVCAAILAFPHSALAGADDAGAKSGEQGVGIRKLGTIDQHMVETTPIVFKGKLYRFESVRPNYDGNPGDSAYYRFVDVDFCEFSGEVVIYYSWGDQVGNEFLAEARYPGTLEQFLQKIFGQ